MRCKFVIRSVAAFIVLALGSLELRPAKSPDLQIKFGSLGVATVSYAGQLLEDTQRYPSDIFHIWHMKMTDLGGKVLSTGEYGWGENNAGKLWDEATHTWTYTFKWGSIKAQMVPSATALNINITETNNSDSGVVLCGVSIYALGLHFPRVPDGFANAAYPHLSDNVSGPSVIRAGYGAGQLTIVNPDVTKPLYTGLISSGQANSYTALVSSTPPQELATFQPHNDRAVRPGETDTFAMSVRFSPTNTALASVAEDVYRKWSNFAPAMLKWKDRRAIGTVYLASSPQGDAGHPHGYRNNPRRYFNDDHAEDFDVSTPDGLTKFQRKVLASANSIVQNLKRMNGQGAITWDIEGEEYPQETSYVCSPDQIASVAPEMESIITDHNSPYVGQKLDDAYFKNIRDAGFRVGVCVRPQHFSKEANGAARQAYLSPADVANELIRKMKYAHDRWGATLFYADSTTESNGAVLDADIIERVALALPDSLLIPEESINRDYAYAAPFHDFLFHGRAGTDLDVYLYYPKAFSALFINDVDPKKLVAAKAQLIDAVRHGDLLMIHADYWHASNDLVLTIYDSAQR